MDKITVPKKHKRNITALEFDSVTRNRLKRIKRVHGLTHTAALARGAALLESQLMGKQIGGAA